VHSHGRSSSPASAQRSLFLSTGAYLVNPVLQEGLEKLAVLRELGVVGGRQELRIEADPECSFAPPFLAVC